MPRPQYQSYGKRGHPHGPPRGNPMPSHSQLQRMSSMPPPPQPAPHQPVEMNPPVPLVDDSATASYSNHEQVARFVHDAWTKAQKDLTDPPEDPACRITYYTEAEPNPLLKDFVPFDLEELRKRRKQLTTSQKS